MTIREEQRDLFTVPQGYYLAHCISADFALGAGIAKKFDEIYDMRFKLFKQYDGYAYGGGDCIVVDNVFNLVTKPKCYHKPTYESLKEALEAMKTYVVHFDINKIAMPHIASGLDRLQWGQVLEIIKEVFEDTDVDILICDYQGA